MITGQLKSQVDSVWAKFWSGGISNPFDVMEQITYLLFIRRLDDLHTLQELKANRLKKPLERPVFPDGDDKNGRSYSDYRWSNFRNFAPDEMYKVVEEDVFPFIKNLAGAGGHFAEHMRNARFNVPTPSILSRVVDELNAIDMDDRDTAGDIYEYLLSKIASAGENGQFRTPRHIIKLMVAMVAPTPTDTICDPAAGTCGFLVVASDYIRFNFEEMLFGEDGKRHFEKRMFTGFDFDDQMLRIGAMNMVLHGHDDPNVIKRDTLGENTAWGKDNYSLILANPPFAGSLNYEDTEEGLLKVARTKKTELLFVIQIIRQLKNGGRAAVVVPDGVLQRTGKAFKIIRKLLVEDHMLQAVVNLPSGVFKPYAGVSTAILFFTKTNSGGTANVWFYDLTADGLSLDDKRAPLLVEEKLGVYPSEELEEGDHELNNLPDVLARWLQRDRSELENPRTFQSFCVPKEEIVDNEYNLSIKTYKEMVYEEEQYDPPQVILSQMKDLHNDIANDMADLEEMLS